MHSLDWIALLVPLAAVIGVALFTQRSMKSVAGYMSGERLAGRYLLSVARGELQAGAVVFVALFEIYAHSGFTTIWWSWITWPIGLVTLATGFVYFRFRETRALTLAQFFELRYGREFRVFTGVLAFVSGILNFGIIPAIGARFLGFLFGLPPELHLAGHAIPTNIPLMAVLLTCTVVMTLSGGAITVLVTNCLEGIFSQIVYVVVLIVLVRSFHWDQIVAALSARPPGDSLLNPMDSVGIKDFNLWFVMMSTFFGIYGTMAMQNSSSYNSAARDPHEGRMGVTLSRLPEMSKAAVVTLIAVCAVTWMTHPDFAGRSGQLAASLHTIENPQIREQMAVPVALIEFLPTGVLGLFCAAMLMGVFGGDSSHLHSWSSILVQDVIVPLRRRPFAPAQHVRALRWAVVGVAVFVFIFGSLFRQTEYVAMWFQLTTGIYVGGAGAAIIGGLYWRRGTAAAAWTSVLTGLVLSTSGILLRQIYGDRFPLNGVEIFFSTSVICSGLYIAVSLFSRMPAFDLDAMLHRERGVTTGTARPPLVQRLLGVDENFTRADRIVVISLFGFTVVLCAISAGGTLWNWISPWPVVWWSRFWAVFGLGIPFGIAVLTAVWFAIGGGRDIRDFFRQIGSKPVNNADDGTVVGRRNAGE